MDRCRLKGIKGDQINAILSASGMNFRKLMKAAFCLPAVLRPLFAYLFETGFAFFAVKTSSLRSTGSNHSRRYCYFEARLTYRFPCKQAALLINVKKVILISNIVINFFKYLHFIPDFKYMICVT